MNLHRCTETDCPVFGQVSTRGCACHRTDVEILREQRDELVAALRELVLTKQIHDKIWSKDMSVSKRKRHIHELDQHKKRAFVLAENVLAKLQVQS